MGERVAVQVNAEDEGMRARGRGEEGTCAMTLRPG